MLLCKRLTRAPRRRVWRLACAPRRWSLSAYKRKLAEAVGEERAAQAWRDVDDVIAKSLLMVTPTLTQP